LAFYWRRAGRKLQIGQPRSRREPTPDKAGQALHGGSGPSAVPAKIERSLAITVLAMATACSPVDDPSLFPEYNAATAVKPPAKEATGYNPERNLYWGDLHIHTSFSTDAYTNGVRATPDDAYTFAKGGEIEHAAGYGIRMSRPLDFAAVTDHSEYLGVLRATEPDLPLNQRGLRDRLLHDGRLGVTIAFARSMLDFDLEDAVVPGWEDISRGAWRETVATAERHNDPGRFTTFVGYEWSSMPGDRNLHRNVIYRGTQVPMLPFSSVDSEDPRDLWSALEQQREQGMESFAIPHNGNVSDGRMYDTVMYDGKPMDATYAARRMENEPLSEIFQVKGSSETNPLLSEEDQFAGFEIYDTVLSVSQDTSRAKGSYARDALRSGLEMSHSENFNPYRFGVIGSSDGHNASSPVEENNYHGKLPLLDGSAAMRMGKAFYVPSNMPGGKRWGAAGLAAVWAQENTRESLYDAMRRKETYATSGPRMTVRFFGGWNFPQDLLQREDWVDLADILGVPMGGDLPSSSGAAPSFAVWAMRDPESGNLDRIQIIKGWVDDAGKSHEKLFDVAWSGQRKHDAADQLPAVGNTVDAATATYDNSIGAEQLHAVWTDPEFDPDQEAFYYARVIEIPTPRWTTYDALKLGIAAPAPSSLQERAVTSAIWYSPK
jgi:Protein of unknown function (DUF3604)